LGDDVANGSTRSADARSDGVLGNTHIESLGRHRIEANSPASRIEASSKGQLVIRPAFNALLCL
jgi:hypothetical protein